MAQIETNERLPLELSLKDAVRIYTRRLGIFLLVVAGNLLIFGVFFLLPKLPTQIIVYLGVVVSLISLITLWDRISVEKRKLIIAVTSVSVFLLFLLVSIRNPSSYPLHPLLNSLPLPTILALAGIICVFISLVEPIAIKELRIDAFHNRYAVGVLGILMIVIALVVAWLQAQ